MSAKSSKKVYAFASKDAEGGAFLMTGTDIREALMKLEERASRRFIMGLPARAKDIASCDKRFMTTAEIATAEVA